MRTIKDFYNHTVANPVAAEIRELKPYNGYTAVILDKTIFYPEGGGQPADRGFINGIPLIDVLEKDTDILHIISAGDAEKLSPGTAELLLDARRRRDFSSQHTGQHIFSSIILKRLGAVTVSMHLGDEASTIDVDKPDISRDQLFPLEDEVQDIIEEDRPITVHPCPPGDIHSFRLRKIPPQGEDVIRVVEIAGCDCTPCCGTHLDSTGKVGVFRVIGAERYKGMTRISFIAGRRVYSESRLLRIQAEGVSRTLNVPVREIFSGAAALAEKAEELERSLALREGELAQLRAEAVLAEAGAPGSPDGLAIFGKIFPGLSYNEVFLTIKSAQKICGAILVFASGQDCKFAAAASKKGVDIRPLFKGLMEARGGQGGGGPLFFQGAFPGRESLEAFMQSLPGKLKEA